MMTLISRMLMLKKEKTKFVPKKYPRPWQMELTKKERENLKKTIEEDTKLYKELSKKIDKDTSSGK